MTEPEKIDKLRRIIEDTLWMAVRYAHGRNTFAPYVVRDSVEELEKIFPDFVLQVDTTLCPIPPDTVFIGNYLHDLGIRRKNDSKLM